MNIDKFGALILGLGLLVIRPLIWLGIIKQKKIDVIDQQIHQEQLHNERLDTIYRAFEILGSQEAYEWFLTPNPALGNKTPIYVLRANGGIEAVQDVLTRIEHGVIE